VDATEILFLTNEDSLGTELFVYANNNPIFVVFGGEMYLVIGDRVLFILTVSLVKSISFQVRAKVSPIRVPHQYRN